MDWIGVIVFLILMGVSNMALNEEGMKLTKQFEGFRDKMYTDTEGVPTIGYGFNMAANKLTNPVMTQAEADALFPTLYQQAVERAAQYAGPMWAQLNPIQQNVLTDMSYNLGNKLMGFKDMQANLLAGKLGDVPKEMINSKWYRQVGQRSPALVKLWQESLLPVAPLAPTLLNPEPPRKVKTGRRLPNG